MKIQFMTGVVVGALVVAGAAYAQMRPQGGVSDTYTFPDGTEVRSAFIGIANSGVANVIQVKKTNGDDCYAILGTSGQSPAIDCGPQ
ncbi:hypothetical protein B9G69_000030 [Bdellovibrio sp. SKB1291214]|uniref:hypothetical protein n=1 Tax=Bdellovibrio sp. SKB1291214 TaxID=1732569 RepID=UPI0011322FFA|nr:hypothetical protein [Bdellovibrio sp. SKB1291214]UYL08960.1 hypothetical protein B9G69_000030 [Bdellovibrio sp. SKB1291214]